MTWSIRIYKNVIFFFYIFSYKFIYVLYFHNLFGMLTKTEYEWRNNEAVNMGCQLTNQTKHDRLSVDYMSICSG